MLIKIGVTLIVIFFPLGLLGEQFRDRRNPKMTLADWAVAFCGLWLYVGILLLVIGGLAFMWSL